VRAGRASPRCAGLMRAKLARIAMPRRKGIAWKG